MDMQSIIRNPPDVQMGNDAVDNGERRGTTRPAKRAVILSALTLSLTAVIILSQILIKFLSDLSENDRILSLLKDALTNGRCDEMESKYE